MPFAGEPAGADPDGVDAVVGQRLAPVEDLRRHAAVDAPDLDRGPAPASSSAPPARIRDNPTAAKATSTTAPTFLALTARHPNLLAHLGSRSAASIARAIRARSRGRPSTSRPGSSRPPRSAGPSGRSPSRPAVAHRHDERVGAGPLGPRAGTRRTTRPGRSWAQPRSRTGTSILSRPAPPDEPTTSPDYPIMRPVREQLGSIQPARWHPTAKGGYNSPRGPHVLGQGPNRFKRAGSASRPRSRETNRARAPARVSRDEGQRPPLHTPPA